MLTEYDRDIIRMVSFEANERELMLLKLIEELDARVEGYKKALLEDKPDLIVRLEKAYGDGYVQGRASTFSEAEQIAEIEGIIQHKITWLRSGYQGVAASYLEGCLNDIRQTQETT